MAKQTFTTGQVLTAAQMTSLQQTAMLGGAANAKTASYVLVAADAGDAITMSNASATTITVNTGLFSAGDIVTIINLGAGVSTITAGTATVSTSGSLALAQNQGGVLRFTSASAAIFFQFATPASGDIEGVTAGTGISGGGTSGTVTITNSMATAIDAKGDLIVGTGADAFSRLAVGTNGQVLTADSAEATGLKFATPGGGSGLTLITNQSLSAGSVNIDNCFSGTYTTYLIILTITNMGSGANIRFRLRAAGTDSTTNYKLQSIQFTSTTASTSISGSTDFWQFGNADPTKAFYTVDLMNPFVADTTFAFARSLTGSAGGYSTPLAEYPAAYNTNATSFDGITIFSHNSATITGNARIYGRADS